MRERERERERKREREKACPSFLIILHVHVVLHMILFYPLKICKLLKLIIEVMINLYIYNNIHWNDITIPVRDPRILYQTICNIVMMYMLYNTTVIAVMKMGNRGFSVEFMGQDSKCTENFIVTLF